MKGLLAKPKVQNLYPGGPVQNVQLQDNNMPFGQGSLAAPANVTNALSTNPSAGAIGLGVPEGLAPNGTDLMNNPNLTLPGAKQANDALGALSPMLMQQAQGQGPNPAQNMLNQATGANVSNTAALMAGQRGASANPGLIARQAGMAGAQMQQQAAGQAATLGAQQQLAAQHQLKQVAAQQIAAQQVANQQNIGMQSNINQSNASLAGGIQQARAGQLGGVQQGMGAMQAVQGQGTGQSPGNESDSTYSKNLQPVAGGIYADGGMVGPRSLVGLHLAKMASGGIVPAKLSPGEIYLSPGQAKAVADGKMDPKRGKHVPGKAKVKGDSLKNDTVNASLEEGGVVIPRTKVQGDKSAAFVRAVMAKNKRR